MIELFEKENFISTEFCEWLIRFHKRYYPTLGDKDDHTNDCQYLDIVSSALELQNGYEYNEGDPLKYLKSLIINFFKSVSNDSYVNVSKIVLYSTGTSYPEHLDHDCSSWLIILYLNDDYTGGENIIDGKIIKPERGKIVAFRGNKVPHGVKKIISGERYVVLAWCKQWSDDDLKNEKN
jgi:hypothetical protein